MRHDEPRGSVVRVTAWDADAGPRRHPDRRHTARPQPRSADPTSSSDAEPHLQPTAGAAVVPGPSSPPDPRGVAAQPVQLYVPAAAAQLLAVPESWLRRKAATRQVPCTFLGKHLRFSHADLVAIIAAGTRPAISGRTVASQRRRPRSR